MNENHEKCKEQGHIDEKVITYDSRESLCECGTCGEIYTRNPTEKEQEKFHNIIRKTYFKKFDYFED